MKEFILFMQDDAERSGTPEEWTRYFAGLHESGRFQGGSAIGNDEYFRKNGSPGAVHQSLGGYIRVLAVDSEDAKNFIAGNPVYEAAIESRELPRTD